MVREELLAFRLHPFHWVKWSFHHPNSLGLLCQYHYRVVVLVLLKGLSEASLEVSVVQRGQSNGLCYCIHLSDSIRAGLAALRLPQH